LKHHLAADTVSALPDSPGVYLFYGSLGELLYVGKSKAIRTRVRSHFSSPEERGLCRRVYRVEARETAGELGALLLESRLIKEVRPLHNVASRRRRRIIVARRSANPQGYAVVNLEAIDYLDVKVTDPILGVFKHKTQAKEYLALIARSHRLCPKLLRLEVTKRYCFSYHLGQCGGACMGEEDVEGYNARVEAAFEARRIKAWPYKAGVAVEERSRNGSQREVFLIDNWCLVASFTSADDGFEKNQHTQHRFDYDSYKILYSYLTDPQNLRTITPISREDFDRLRLDVHRDRSDYPDIDRIAKI
jgi:DNA polymerase-3 subunit epsilon